MIFIFIILLVTLAMVIGINKKFSLKKKLIALFISLIFLFVAFFFSELKYTYNDNYSSEHDTNIGKININSSTQSPTTRLSIMSNNISQYLDGVSNDLKLKYIYEGDEFYSPMIDYYTPTSSANNQVYVFIEEPIKERQVYYGETFIKNEILLMGFQEKQIQMVYDIADVPNYSVLIIVLSEKHSPNQFEYEKSIKSYIGYSNFKAKRYQDLRIFGKVYFFGQPLHFTQFHLALDRYLTHHKQYRVIQHPYLRNNQVVHLVTLASINPKSKIAPEIKVIEELQFPESFDCQTQRSIVSDFPSWGMFSVIHVMTYRLILTMFSKRMLIVNQGGFQYGQLNHLYLPMSFCDNVPIENKHLLPSLNTISYPNDSDVNMLFTPKEASFKDFFNNYVPPEVMKTFVDGYHAQTFVLDYLFAPTLALREFIEQTTRETFKKNYQPRCISMHIRHGDKYAESPIYDFKYYADILQTLSKKQIEEYEKTYTEVLESYYKEQNKLKKEEGSTYEESKHPKPTKPIVPLSSITDIFIMTDDQGVLDDAIEWSKTPPSYSNRKYNIRSVDGVERLNHHSFAHSTFDSKSERVDHGMIMHAESVIASRCELFIGTMSSNVGRAIAELQGAQYEFNGKNMSYVSLDMEYYKDLSVVPVYTELKKKGLI